MFKSRGLLAFALALAGCGAPSEPPGPHAGPDGGLRYGALSFKSCALSVARGPSIEAWCTKLAVPENYDEPDGRTIELAVALVTADGQASSDPIVMIAGGPGQSALDSYPLVHNAFADARRNLGETALQDIDAEEERERHRREDEGGFRVLAQGRSAHLTTGGVSKEW